MSFRPVGPAGPAEKSITVIPQDEYDAVVSMGYGDACPIVAAKLREECQIPDPKAMGLDEFRKVRDMIREQVKVLLSRL